MSHNYMRTWEEVLEDERDYRDDQREYISDDEAKDNEADILYWHAYSVYHQVPAEMIVEKERAYMQLQRAIEAKEKRTQYYAECERIAELEYLRIERHEQHMAECLDDLWHSTYLPPVVENRMR